MTDNNTLLENAFSCGYFIDFQRIIILADPACNYFSALGSAVAKGHAQCVATLAPHCENAWAYLAIAAGIGQHEIVQTLIPFCADRPHLYDCSLEGAISCNDNGDNDMCIELLIPISDPEIALNLLKNDSADQPRWLNVLLARVAEVQRDRIDQALNDCDTSKSLLNVIPKKL